MQRALYIAFFCLPLLACGQSALLQVQRETTEREGRIVEKERELGIQENQRQVLISQQKALLSEIESQQLTVDQLNTKLEQLRKENALTIAETEAQKNKKASLDRQLEEYQKKIAALQKDKRLPDEEKKKRIEQLKKQISDQLKLMLTS